MARRNKHVDAHARLRAEVKGAIGFMINMASGYLAPNECDYSRGQADAYLRSAHFLASNAGLLDEFPKLVFWRAWTTEWLDHPRCERCGAWRCDTLHTLKGGSYRWGYIGVCTKCALEMSLAPAKVEPAGDALAEAGAAE